MSCYYVGLDVHKASICIAVLNPEGELVMESVIETSAPTILDFLTGLRGQVEVTFEEGTHAARLHDVLHKTKAHIIVCDPRKNRLLHDGNKSDQVDARKLALLPRAGLLSPETRGLTRGHSRTLKYVFKSAALTSSRREPFKTWYSELRARGSRPESARVTMARKIAAITLAVWKAGEDFDGGKVIGQAA